MPSASCGRRWLYVSRYRSTNTKTKGRAITATNLATTGATSLCATPTTNCERRPRAATRTPRVAYSGEQPRSTSACTSSHCRTITDRYGSVCRDANLSDRERQRPVTGVGIGRPAKRREIGAPATTVVLLDRQARVGQPLQRAEHSAHRQSRVPRHPVGGDVLDRDRACRALREPCARRSNHLREHSQRVLVCQSAQHRHTITLGHYPLLPGAPVGVVATPLRDRRAAATRAIRPEARHQLAAIFRVVPASRPIARVARIDMPRRLSASASAFSHTLVIQGRGPHHEYELILSISRPFVPDFPPLSRTPHSPRLCVPPPAQNPYFAGLSSGSRG